MLTDDMPVIDLAASAYERGVSHGHRLASSIAELCQKSDHQLGIRLNQSSRKISLRGADDFKGWFLDNQDFKQSIAQWTPDLLEEMQGIADGSGVSFDDIFFLNLTDEVWSWFAEQESSVAGGHCSCFGISGQHKQPTWSGQNMDVGQWREGYQLLLRIRQGDSGAFSYVFSCPGMLALNGMNNAPIGISCNSLLTLRSVRQGLPVAFIVRRFLEYQSIDEAVAFLTSVPHASGQNYVVAAPGVVRSFECSATNVTEYRPNATRLCHTNHPLSNPDINQLAPTADALASTHARFASINARLCQAEQEITLKDIKLALSAHDNSHYPVSRTGDYADSPIGYTLGASIYELSDKPKLHIAAGPPCKTPWRVFSLSGTPANAAIDGTEG